MKRKVFPLVLLAAIACTPSKPAAPPVDVAAEAAKIKQLETEAFAMEARKDLDGLMTLVTDDILVQGPGAGEIRGKDAMRKLYEEVFKLPIVSAAGGSLEAVVAASGDIGYDVGWNRMQIKGAPADSGKYLAVWRKVNGAWKISAFSYSSNGAPKK